MAMSQPGQMKPGKAFAARKTNSRICGQCGSSKPTRASATSCPDFDCAVVAIWSGPTPPTMRSTRPEARSTAASMLPLLPCSKLSLSSLPTLIFQMALVTSGPCLPRKVWMRIPEILLPRCAAMFGWATSASWITHPMPRCSPSDAQNSFNARVFPQPRTTSLPTMLCTSLLPTPALLAEGLKYNGRSGRQRRRNALKSSGECSVCTRWVPVARS